MVMLRMTIISARTVIIILLQPNSMYCSTCLMYIDPLLLAATQYDPRQASEAQYLSRQSNSR